MPYLVRDAIISVADLNEISGPESTRTIAQPFRVKPIYPARVTIRYTTRMFLAGCCGYERHSRSSWQIFLIPTFLGR
jgi:hypothetical protein